MRSEESKERIYSYKFVYKGDSPPLGDKNIQSNLNPFVINLYRKEKGRDFWHVEVDFPSPLEPLAPIKPCSDFLNLLSLIEESEAKERFEKGERKPGDDLLLFGRSLREIAEQKAEICLGERVLTLKPWSYDHMGVRSSSRAPIPYYDCLECRESIEVVQYNEMIVATIIYIANKSKEYRIKSSTHNRISRPEEIEEMLK